jgi:hypothetical protein
VGGLPSPYLLKRCTRKNGKTKKMLGKITISLAERVDIVWKIDLYISTIIVLILTGTSRGCIAKGSLHSAFVLQNNIREMLPTKVFRQDCTM